MPVAPLSSTDILNFNSGQASNVSSVSVTLTGGVGSGSTTAGNAVIILAQGGQAALATPSGFTLDTSLPGGNGGGLYAFRKQPCSASETSWTVSTSSGTGAIQWAVFEVQRLASSPVVSATQNGGDASLLSFTDSTLGSLARNDVLILGMFRLEAATSTATLDPITYTLSTTLPWGKPRTAAELKWAASASFNYRTLFYTEYTYPSGVGGDRTVTASGSGGTSNDFWGAITIAYASAESGGPDPLAVADGFEYGITPNTAAPAASMHLVDLVNGTFGTQYAVSSAAPRSGAYHLRITQSAAAGRVGWDTNTLGTSKDEAVLGAGFKLNSSTGTVVLAEIAPASGTILQLVYDTTNTQLGVRWGSGGTIAYQQRTTATGSYVWVDLSADGFTGTTRAARWSLNGEEQDAPADLTGQTASSLLSVTLGLNASQTVTFDVDDVVVSTTVGNYPLGRHHVRLLTVDPAATPTGNLTTNFNTFSANATLTAYNATTARNAVDEVPPTISASADGLVQVTASTSALVTFAMDTYTMATGEFIDYVGLLAPLWANSAQTATLDIRAAATGGVAATNPLTVATAFNPGNAAQPASATVPMWMRSKWVNGVGWSQSSLNSVTVEFGRSDDATPDIGVHAIYLQVAVVEAISSRIYGPDQDGLTVDVTQGAGNLAVRTYQVTGGATLGATLRYMNDTTEVVKTITAGGSLTETVSAVDFDQIPRVTVEPDPVP